MQIELFYLSNHSVPVGALMTATDHSSHYCRIRFSTPDGGIVDNEALVRMNGSIRDWTSFTFRDGAMESVGTRDSHGVTVAGHRVDHEGTVVPSYGVSALVAEMVRELDEAVEFRWLTESAGSAHAVLPARLERTDDEDVASPVTDIITGCARVELSVDGTRTNTYWVKDGAVVATDWNGATSFALPANTAFHLRAALGLEGHGRSALHKAE